MKIPGGFSRFYGPSLHQQFKGEWNYNLNWKPHVAPLVRASWIAAVYKAQKTFRKGISISEPVFLMFSKKSVKGKRWRIAFHYGDAVVKVRDIRKGACHIYAPLKIHEVANAKHDLFLSVKEVRNEVYEQIFEWLDESLQK